MFKDKYKKANDSLKPSEATKQRIEKLIEAEGQKKIIQIKFPYKRFIAAVASIAIIAVGIYFGASRDSAPIVKDNTESKVIETVKPQNIKNGYKELYNAYDKLYKRSKSEKHYGYVSKDLVDAEGELVATEDGIALKGNSAADVNTNSSNTQKKDHSDTNVQVEGVDEADIVKTDGENIYVLKNDYEPFGAKVNVYSAKGINTRQISSINIKPKKENYRDFNAREMYLSGNRLVVIISSFVSENDNSDTQDKVVSFSDVNYGYYLNSITQFMVYDITDHKDIKLVNKGAQDGLYCSSRMVGGKLYLVTEHSVKLDGVKKDDIDTYVPKCIVGEDTLYVSESCICIPEAPDSSSMIVTAAYNSKDGKQISSASVLGGGSNVYMNSEYMVISEYVYPHQKTGVQYDYTDLLLFSVKDGNIEYKTKGRVKGSLLNQFSMDVYEGHLRVCTTVTKQKIIKKYKYNYVDSTFNATTTNSLYVLSLDKMEAVGSIEGLAEDERIYSARFTGEIGYFVTFRETDPLFAVDLKNPREPKILSALKIDGFSSYLHPFSEDTLLGFGYNTENSVTTSLKLTMFDIKDLTDVREIVTQTVSNRYADSEGVYNHKAIFVDTEKQLIGFNMYNYREDQNEYCVYKYNPKEKDFEQKCKLYLDLEWANIRGLYVGDHFYVCADGGIAVYNMSDFKHLITISAQ